MVTIRKLVSRIGTARGIHEVARSLNLSRKTKRSLAPQKARGLLLYEDNDPVMKTSVAFVESA